MDKSILEFPAPNATRAANPLAQYIEADPAPHPSLEILKCRPPKEDLPSAPPRAVKQTCAAEKHSVLLQRLVRLRRPARASGKKAFRESALGPIDRQKRADAKIRFFRRDNRGAPEKAPLADSSQISERIVRRLIKTTHCRRCTRPRPLVGCLLAPSVPSSNLKTA